MAPPSKSSSSFPAGETASRIPEKPPAFSSPITRSASHPAGRGARAQDAPRADDAQPLGQPRRQLEDRHPPLLDPALAPDFSVLLRGKQPSADHLDDLDELAADADHHVDRVLELQDDVTREARGLESPRSARQCPPRRPRTRSGSPGTACAPPPYRLRNIAHPRTAANGLDGAARRAPGRRGLPRAFSPAGSALDSPGVRCYTYAALRAAGSRARHGIAGKETR